MSLLPNSDLVFTVHRHEPELIAPARPTTHECKFLSDIDDQEALRNHIHVIQFYRNYPTVTKGRDRDPVKVIRDAIAETLVFYYPFAGRLRECPGRKLVVDCTGEGLLFIEADADVSLSEFGDSLHPPIPCLEELLYEVPGFSGILDSPLILIQVTRLNCGGFIFALRLNHTMSDSTGLLQFMTAIGEIARGACVPSVKPVWQRHLLNSRDEPRITCEHQEFEELAPGAKGTIGPHSNMVNYCFFFGTAEVSALRRLVPPHLISKCSSFDLIATCFWRCRTISLQMDPEKEVRILYVMNARGRLRRPLPIGYYGNAFAYPAAVSTSGEISKNSFGYALELVMNAKYKMTEEYLESVADLLVTKGRPHFIVEGAHLVADSRNDGFYKVDYGWGKPTYGGVAKGWFGAFPGVASFFSSFKNSNEEYGVLMPIFLPAHAMNIFEAELNSLLEDHIQPAFTAKI